MVENLPLRTRRCRRRTNRRRRRMRFRLQGTARGRRAAPGPAGWGAVRPATRGTRGSSSPHRAPRCRQLAAWSHNNENTSGHRRRRPASATRPNPGDTSTAPTSTSATLRATTGTGTSATPAARCTTRSTRVRRRGLRGRSRRGLVVQRRRRRCQVHYFSLELDDDGRVREFALECCDAPVGLPELKLALRRRLALRTTLGRRQPIITARSEHLAPITQLRALEALTPQHRADVLASGLQGVGGAEDASFVDSGEGAPRWLGPHLGISGLLRHRSANRAPRSLITGRAFVSSSLAEGASGEVWATLPKTTWSTSLALTHEAINAAREAMTPRSVAL